MILSYNIPNFMLSQQVPEKLPHAQCQLLVYSTITKPPTYSYRIHSAFSVVNTSFFLFSILVVIAVRSRTQTPEF